MSKQWLFGAKALVGLLGAALIALATMPASAQVKPTVMESGVEHPHSAIYIGNSFFYYNNSLHNQVTRLIHAGDPKYRFRSTSVTISGSGSDWHDVGSYFRPNAIGRYSFNTKNEIVFNKLDRLFDLAIMMDCSQCPVHPQLKAVFFEQMKQHADTVRKHGTKPVFFMSWAYADAPEMTAQLADAYTTAANNSDAFVIPAGLAFAQVDRAAAAAQSLCRRQAAPEPGRHLSRRRHHLRRAVPQIPGRPEIHRRPRSGDRGIPADRGVADVAGVFPAAQRVGAELIFERMRKHLAHDGRQRLARQSHRSRPSARRRARRRCAAPRPRRRSAPAGNA